MSESTHGTDPAQGADDAATEAAQNVVDETTSWEYSAERDTIEEHLDDGLAEAGVTVDEDEKQRLVDEIDDVKDDETAGSPRVDPDSATPSDGA